MPTDPVDDVQTEEAISAQHRQQAKEPVTFIYDGFLYQRIRYVDDVAAVNTAEFSHPDDHLAAEAHIAAELVDQQANLQSYDAARMAIDIVDESIFRPLHQEQTFRVDQILDLIDLLTEYFAGWHNGLKDHGHDPDTLEAVEAAHGAALLIFSYLMPSWVAVERLKPQHEGVEGVDRMTATDKKTPLDPQLFSGPKGTAGDVHVQTGYPIWNLIAQWQAEQFNDEAVLAAYDDMPRTEWEAAKRYYQTHKPFIDARIIINTQPAADDTVPVLHTADEYFAWLATQNTAPAPLSPPISPAAPSASDAAH